MSIDPGGQVVNFDVGIYKGDLNDQGVPHGHGRLDYKVDDILSRKYYEGQWSLGKNTGQGRYHTSRNSRSPQIVAASGSMGWARLTEFF